MLLKINFVQIEIKSFPLLRVEPRTQYNFAQKKFQHYNRYIMIVNWMETYITKNGFC